MTARIAHVIRFTNGMVMVFDEQGEQMPEYQGRFEDVRQKLMDATDNLTLFQEADWCSGKHGPAMRAKTAEGAP
jgi:hypothetical protein